MLAAVADVSALLAAHRRSPAIDTLEANDMRFATSQGFNSGDQFFSYLKDSFDVLYAESGAGCAGIPRRNLA
ncbi:hypothetical protein JIR23_13390 [Bradyrhizobium diazoefficiens]|nr:hypothetical protein [Bradyrhizobium diazoefficiens]QQN67532.1 hypothetical protein JIR23_13390 [Bradyrhizobium diazoefficiens]